jgi:hypothetical protein
MTLRTNARGIRAAASLVACAALALSPAVADAASKKAKHVAKKHIREASKPAKKVAAPRPAASETGLVEKLDLAPSVQMAAMNTAIKAAPTFFGGLSSGCTFTTPMLTSQPGPVMAGNFRDAQGDCWVWLNLQQSSMLTGQEICKTALHEMGHLTGLAHSPDPSNIMFTPFQTNPMPSPCVAAKTA